MLSAVAARKARLQSQVPAQEPPSRASPSPSPEPEDVVEHEKPSSKRKASAPKQSRKKRKVNKSEKKQPARYFAQKDGFKEQDDLIVVEDDEHEDDSSSESGESSGELFSLPAMSSVSAPPKQRRAWSPSAPPVESSEDEDDGIAFEASVLDAPPPTCAIEEPPQLLSTFHPVLDQNIFHLSTEEIGSLGLSSTASAKLLALQQADRLALLGTYSLIVLRGAIQLNGVEVTPSLYAHPVFAPRSSPLPIIECASTDEPSGSPAVELPSRVATSASRAAAVVIIQELRTGVEGLGRVCRTFEDAFQPSRWQRNQTNVDLGLEGVHYITYQNQDAQPFVVPPSWKRTLQAALVEKDEGQTFPRKVFLVQGAKKTGKSTFARTLANKLLSRYKHVAFLECDLGQSEFTAGGMVALNVMSSYVFGPPFTHPSIPHSAHYLGSTTPRNLPSQYVEAIGALVQTYNLDIQHGGLFEEQGDEDHRITDVVPLVVNMMGWTKGLGADLSRRVLEAVEPSVVFDFEALPQESGWRNGDYADGPAPLDPGLEGTFTRYVLETIPSSAMSQRYSPADQRTLSLLSHFHAVFPAPSAIDPLLQSTYAVAWNVALPLCAQTPYELAADAAVDAVILSGPGSEDVVPSEVHRVLNGAVVALVSCEPGALDFDISQDHARAARGIPYVQGAAPPPPAASTCHGLALVRSVSPDTPAKLHILTPLPPALLARVQPRVLLKGELELPVWGLLDFRTDDAVAGVPHAQVPFLRWGPTAGTGGDRRRVRRNLMRRGQQ
ncbi:polynucleotide 5'-hydroxyl-kinase GRC3 [Phanerochaete sordida]|uniref:Polynucleotide 5'-hydroxyl-kinase GRC3 n=1 Tax=Phanerochaete sordida TaxID=48140 RepID=A0A9P3L6X7_9APHY|nr:polynucleotide 5'-hydroxyl-kinase GRC3 [Phanerochaete sordida]